MHGPLNVKLDKHIHDANGLHFTLLQQTRSARSNKRGYAVAWTVLNHTKMRHKTGNTHSTVAAQDYVNMAECPAVQILAVQQCDPHLNVHYLLPHKAKTQNIIQD